MQAPDGAADCGSNIAQLPELALDTIFGMLDAQSLAAVSQACSAWQRRVASCPQLYRTAFWQRFGNKAEGGWWPFFECREQLYGHRDWLGLYQPTLWVEGVCEERRDWQHLYQATLWAEGVCEERVLREALRRQLYHREQYQKTLEANRQVVTVCERSLAKAQASLERHLSPRGLLPFGRREGFTRASLRTDVEHWQRELAGEQATVRGLEPLEAQAVAKVQRIQARLRALAARRQALREARLDLDLADAPAMLRSMVDKFALPRLRARVATAYMFYDKAAHAVK
ncbi:hypothetical protein WJX81_008482 [Elliptochloris bilobata]|uniref:F-box domain-containing protein n=1 Tax=Elliptochloris bilobata TaxID=381761 RepID=A0AAW1SE18_9CHLO